MTSAVRLPDGLVEGVRARVGAGRPVDVATAVAAELAVAGVLAGPRQLARMVEAVRDELVGAGPLQPLLDEPEVTDVLVNGPDEVWVERAGVLAQVDVRLGDPAGVRALAVRLAALAGRRLDDACPAVDGRLPDGTRLHALLPPMAGPCTVLSLRTAHHHAASLHGLAMDGMVHPGLYGLLATLVDVRANLLISGATGAGKTTLLSALLGEVDPGQRLVVIEEQPELQVSHPHVLQLSTRGANVEGAGVVDLPALVRHALRMRPDRIALGECRGAEVRDVLVALNTGHEGGFATLHANTAADVPARLEALAALAGMAPSAVAAQAAAAFDAVVHLRRGGPSRAHRYVAELGVVQRDEHGVLVVDVAVQVHPDGAKERGPGWPALVERLGADAWTDDLPPGVARLRPRPQVREAVL